MPRTRGQRGREPGPNSPDQSAVAQERKDLQAEDQEQMCLSSANETTPGTALSPCITGPYVPVAPHWHLVPATGHNA